MPEKVKTFLGACGISGTGSVQYWLVSGSQNIMKLSPCAVCTLRDGCNKGETACHNFLFLLFLVKCYFYCSPHSLDVSLLSVDLRETKSLKAFYVGLFSKTNIHFLWMDCCFLPSVVSLPFHIYDSYTQTKQITIKAFPFVIISSYEFQLQSFFTLHSSNVDILILLVNQPSWHLELNLCISPL